MDFILKEVIPWLQNVARLSVLLPLLIGLYHFRNRGSHTFRLLLLYTISIALVEVVGFAVVYVGTDNNLWITHLYTPIEFLLISAIYYYSYSSKLMKRTLQAVTACFVLASSVLIVWGQKLTEVNSYARTLAAILLIAMALAYLYQTANNLKYTYLDRDPVFVLSCGVLLYQAGTSMAYAQFNAALAESYAAAAVCVAIILLLNILFRFILMLALKRAP